MHKLCALYFFGNLPSGREQRIRVVKEIIGIKDSSESIGGKPILRSLLAVIADTESEHHIDVTTLKSNSWLNVFSLINSVGA